MSCCDSEDASEIALSPLGAGQRARNVHDLVSEGMMLDIVRSEIESLHRFFVRWFSGECPRSDAEFAEGFTVRFEPEFKLIPPAGNLLALEDLSQSVRKGHGSNPDFRIQIRNVRLQRQEDSLVVATYEEWQRNARASTPPDNGRIATVLFRATPNCPLLWLHVHETWLPRETMERGPYDF